MIQTRRHRADPTVPATARCCLSCAKCLTLLDPGAVPRLRRPGPGGQYLRQLPQPRRDIPSMSLMTSSARAQPTLPQASSKECRWAARCQAPHSSRPPAPRLEMPLIITGASDGPRDPATRRGRGLRRHARPCWTPHVGRDRNDQTKTTSIRLEGQDVYRPSYSSVTFVLTMLIPLQYAVLVGVGLSGCPPCRSVNRIR